MTTETLDELRTAGLITGAQHQHLTRIYDRSLFSVHYELRTMLYVGVLMFTTGIGIVIYRNVDSIGHMVIIGVLMALTAACFWYVARLRPPYTNAEVKSPSNLYDYVLLLGCMLFATVVGYLQVQYAVFGEHDAVAALVPGVVCLAMAYACDHRGVLSLGIAGIASWLGLTVSPIALATGGIFSGGALIATGLIFGAVLCITALLLDRASIKKHFTFTYLNIASHILFIACLAGLFVYDDRTLEYMALLAVLSGAAVWYARRTHSFLFLLSASVYFYIGLTYVIHTAGLTYYFVSGAAFVLLLFNYKKLLARA